MKIFNPSDSEHQAFLNSSFKHNLREFISVEEIKRLTGGASRQMYLIKVQTRSGASSFVLRLAAISGDMASFDQLSLKNEVAVIKAVLKNDVLVPEVLFEFTDESGFGSGYVMEFIKGETLGGRIAKSKRFIEGRRVLNAQCAKMLAKIHLIDIQKADLARVLPKLEPKTLVDRMYQLYRFSGLHIPMLEFTYRWLHEHLPEKADQVLTHGDFRNGNLLVDAHHGLQGILDWELAAISDPMKDVAWICLNPWRFGESQLEVGGFGTLQEFLSIYESEIGHPVNLHNFKFWTVYGSFWWCIVCILMGLSYRIHDSQRGDKVAIGRRYSESLIDLVNELIPGPMQSSSFSTSVNADEVSTLNELIASSLKDLTKDIVEETHGKTKFATRVVMSNLAVALRELRQGPERDQFELRSAQRLLGRDFQNVQACRKELCAILREQDWSMDKLELEEHLRACIGRQIAIDQPNYSGYTTALSKSYN